jgi:hypothetical protein
LSHSSQQSEVFSQALWFIFITSAALDSDEETNRNFLVLGKIDPSEKCQNRIETRRPTRLHRDRETVLETTGTEIETETAAGIVIKTKAEIPQMVVAGARRTDKVGAEVKRPNRLRSGKSF